ncbi:helix-turn-helix domain-containing protein [Crocosphaera sp.]|uniref:helix-turn-helix domain-containing protein n=1 Tax=Crocosphaera sp. TaxID=2729996 RepID=UPI003F273298
MEKNTPTTDPSLKDLIKLAGYTQKSFAQALNTAYSTVKYYVSGEKMPGVKIFADMCRLLDKSPKTVMKSLGIDVSGIPDDQPTDQ